MHNWGQVFISEELVKPTVIEGPVITNYTLKENVFYTFLFNQKSIESEETHDVWDENLSGSITLIFKNYTLEQF